MTKEYRVCQYNFSNAKNNIADWIRDGWKLFSCNMEQGSVYCMFERDVEEVNESLYPHVMDTHFIGDVANRYRLEYLAQCEVTATYKEKLERERTRTDAVRAYVKELWDTPIVKLNWIPTLDAFDKLLK